VAAGKPSRAQPPAFTYFAKRCCPEALLACPSKPISGIGVDASGFPRGVPAFKREQPA
jgi:hypothetical protein